MKSIWLKKSFFVDKIVRIIKIKQKSSTSPQSQSSRVAIRAIDIAWNSEPFYFALEPCQESNFKESIQWFICFMANGKWPYWPAVKSFRLLQRKYRTKHARPNSLYSNSCLWIHTKIEANGNDDLTVCRRCACFVWVAFIEWHQINSPNDSQFQANQNNTNAKCVSLFTLAVPKWNAKYVTTDERTNTGDQHTSLSLVFVWL